jgi:hypothetical protein
MTVIVDKDAPENVLESYTFSFKYTGALGELNTCLSTISLGATGCVADMRTMQTARLGIEMIVRRLITLTSFLPMLPSMFSRFHSRIQRRSLIVSRQEIPRNPSVLHR